MCGTRAKMNGQNANAIPAAAAPIVNIAMQLRPDERMRGRVIGTLTSFAYAAGPLGYLTAGGLLTWLGVQGTLLLLAAVVLGAVALTAFRPALRDFDALRLEVATHD